MAEKRNVAKSSVSPGHDVPDRGTITVLVKGDCAVLMTGTSMMGRVKGYEPAVELATRLLQQGDSPRLVTAVVGARYPDITTMLLQVLRDAGQRVQLEPT